MSISSNLCLDQTQALPFLTGRAHPDSSSSAMTMDSETLARVVEVAASALATQKKIMPSSSTGESNEQSTLDFLDGVYVGEVQNGEPHGRGTMDYYPAFNDKHRYEGEWQDGEFHGHGKLLYSNGDQYDGEWQNGLFHGKGIYEWQAPCSDGSTRPFIHEGNWEFGYRHGEGKTVTPSQNGDKLIAQGSFVAGCLHGEGKRDLRYPSKEFRGGVLHGKEKCGNCYHAGKLIEGKDGSSKGIFRDKYSTSIAKKVFTLWDGEKHDNDQTVLVRGGISYVEVDLCQRSIRMIEPVRGYFLHYGYLPCIVLGVGGLILVYYFSGLL